MDYPAWLLTASLDPTHIEWHAEENTNIPRVVDVRPLSRPIMSGFQVIPEVRDSD